MVAVVATVPLYIRMVLKLTAQLNQFQFYYCGVVDIQYYLL